MSDGRCIIEEAKGYVRDVQRLKAKVAAAEQRAEYNLLEHRISYEP